MVAINNPRLICLGFHVLTGRIIHSAFRQVAGNNRRWWRNSAMALNRALPNTLFNRLGVPTLAS
jgi:hypothetical protein